MPSRHDSLHFAVVEGDVSLVAALLAAGADPNARDRHGATPLWHAVRSDGDSLDILDALIGAGADLAATHEDGWTALHAAASWTSSAARVARLLGAGAPVEARDAQGKTPLYVAVESAGGKRTATVDTLLAAGADVNTRESNGSAPLHFLACWGHVALAEVLLAEGAEAGPIETDTGRTPLHYACEDGSAAMVDLLLRHGADPNVRCAWGPTPLMEAVVHGDPAIVRALLGAGAARDGALAIAREWAEDGVEKRLLANADRTGSVSVARVTSDIGQVRVRVEGPGWRSREHVEGHREIIALLTG